MKKRVSKNELRAAVDLYRKFREEEPEKLNAVEIVVPKVVMVVGYAEYVGYSTTHGKKSTLYEHKFAEGSRPLLCASADGRQLLFVGGRYNFTEDGIVDYDATGKSLYPKDHGKFRSFNRD